MILLLASGTSMSTGDSNISRRDLRVAVILAVVAAVAGAFWIRPFTVGMLHDDGVYVTTAKALAEGRGYRVISLPNEPLQTKYPFLYPLALAIVWKVWPSFPNNVVALKVFGLLCAAASVGLAYLYVIRFRYFSRRTALWAGALCATTPFFLMFTAQAISDGFFALLVVLALWRLDWLAERRDEDWRASLVTGLIVGLPFIARSIGIVVGVPVIAAGLRPRHMMWVALGVALAWLPWVLWVMLALNGSRSDPITQYQIDYLGLTGTLDRGPNFSFWWSESSRSYIPTMLLWNLAFTLLSAAALPLGGLTAVLSRWDPRFLILLVVGGLVTWWTVSRARDRSPVLKWFLLTYALAVCVWPWRSSRFFMPLLPLLTPFLITGASRMVRPVLAKEHIATVARVSLCAALILNGSTVVGWKSVTRLVASGSDQETVVLWPSISLALDWLKTNAASDDIVAAPDDPLVYLYTSRKAIRPFVYEPASLFYGAKIGATGTVSDFVSNVKPYRPAFLLYYPSLLGAEDFAALITAAREQYPGWMVAVYRTPDPRVIVFRFDWNHGPPLSLR